ncbi:MAG: hypothetical protein AAF572_00930 [Cyanobacteria bacterium P01_B01_bin.77]
MANPNITPKVSTLPWPVLAGTSVLLHAGMLMVGLPQILPVDNPGDSSVNIPITLVGDDRAPAAVPDNLPQATPQMAAPTNLPQTAPQQTPASQPVPIGGQNSANPTEQATQPPTQQSEPQGNTGVEPIPKLESSSPPRPQTPDQNPSIQKPATDTDSQLAETDNDDQTAGSRPTLVTIRKVQIPEQLNLADDPEPNFQLPVSLTIPSGPFCEGSIVANQPVDISVEIAGINGQILPLPDSVPPELEAANCLLMSAVNVDPTRVSFNPATPDTGDFDFAQEGSISAIGRLTLIFE